MAGGVDDVDEHHPHDLIDHPQPYFPTAQLILRLVGPYFQFAPDLRLILVAILHWLGLVPSLQLSGHPFVDSPSSIPPFHFATPESDSGLVLGHNRTHFQSQS